MTPKWKDVDTSESNLTTIHLVSLMSEYFTDNYTKLCTIEADLSRSPILTRPKATGKGSFYRVDFDVILLFGMTELQAQVAWKENVSCLCMFNINRFRINFMCDF